MQTIDFQRLNLQPQHTLLDFGCGEGRHAIGAAAFTSIGKVIGFDLNPKDIHTARSRQLDWPNCAVEWMIADGLRLPFADQSFDVVICSEVLEHLPDFETALQEIARVLKLGGQLAISVPRAWPERICWALSRAYHEVEGGHVRIFNAKQLAKKIEAMSFACTSQHFAHALHSPYWWLRCLFWRSDEQVAIVRWYHKLLVWDLMQKPWLTQTLEKCLNPVLGKSVVMYFTKEGSMTEKTSN